MKRFWAFFFGIIFGWVLLFGGIAVAAYTISLSTFNVKTGWEDKQGNSFDEMSFASIITKGVEMISSGNLTLQQIEDTYGIDVLEIAGFTFSGTEDPYASLRTVSLTQFISDPANALSAVALGDIADSPLLAQFNLSANIKTAWATNGATVGDIIKGDFATVLEGVTISDIMPNFTSEGITGIMAGKDLGAFFTALKAANADPIGFILEGVFVGDIMNYKLNKSQDISAYTTVIEGKILQDNTDYYKAKVLNGVTDWCLADFTCDNTDAVHLHDEHCYRFVWADKDNITVAALTSALANLEISTLLSGNNLDFGTLASGMYIGDIMNYTKQGDSWYNGDNKVNATTSVIADIKISDIVGGNFNLSNTFDGLFIGDLLSYNFDEATSIWTKEGGGALSAMEEAMAKISVSSLTGGGFDINSVFNDLKVGDLMGYKFNETESKWYNGLNPIDTLMSTFADVLVSDMLNGSFDVMNTVGDLKVGELLGFTLNTATLQWEKGTNIITDSVINTVYSYKINEMDTVDLNGIVGYIGSLMGFVRKNIDGSEYTLLIENVYEKGGLYAIKDGEVFYEAKLTCTNTDVAHIHNKDCYLFVWYSDNTFASPVAARENNMANLIASDLTSGFNIDKILNGLKLGDILGYEYITDAWYNGNVLADDLTQKICNMEFNELKDGFDVMSIFGDTKLGTLMGYTFNTDENRWYHDGTAVDTIKQKLAEKTLSEIQSGFDIISIFGDTKLGELMGYTLEGEIWYNNSIAVDTLTQAMANQTLTSLQDGFDINTIFGVNKVGDLLGYTFDDLTGKWQGSNGAVDPISQNLCSKLVSEITGGGLNMNDLINGVKLGDIITIDANSPAILKELADTNVNEIGTKMNLIYLGDLQNYERKEISDISTYDTIVVEDKILSDGTNYIKIDNGAWYEAVVTCAQTHIHDNENCFDFVWYTDDTFASKVTGIQKVIVNMTIANIDVVNIVDKINDMPFNELFTGDTTTGALSLIPAGTTIRNLPTALSEAVNNSTIEKLMEADLLILTPDVVTKLNAKFGDTWKPFTIAQFISALVNLI